MTHLITDDSIAVIERHKKKPFFLYVSHECPHFPFQGPADKDKIVTEENWTEPDAKAYVAMLQDLDSEVGRLLAALDKHELADNTVVVFVSDNGGFAAAANMGPLSGAKSSTLEGGIRVPLIIRWPKRIKPDTTCNQVSATFDLTKSFLQLAQSDGSADRLDGYDILSHVTEGRDDLARTLFWRGKRGDRVWSAVRDGDLKYVQKTEGDASQEWLFDLSSDIGEKNDLRSVKPSDADRLKKLLNAWDVETKAVR
jgi:arylsulfatase A